MPGRGGGPSSTLGPDARTGLVDPIEGYPDQLAPRRTWRDCDSDIAELRHLLDAHERGEIDLESFGWQVGNIGARLGAWAARGELRVAS
jgi:hypothetical protein